MNTSGAPLAGRRIVVTRARQQAGSLAESLRKLGAEIFELPLIEIVPPESYGPLDRALEDISQYQWLIVTSANAVRALADRATTLALDRRLFSVLRIAAIGSATAAELEKEGWRADLVPTEYVAESILASLRNQVRNSRVLVARAAVARDVIPQELRRLGANVDVVDTYRNVIPPGAVENFQKIFHSSAVIPEAVTFTSSSTVKHFFALLDESGLSALPAQLRALSIGPITSATLREHGWEPSVEAEVHNVEGLVGATVQALSTSSPAA